jgi:hypothetical protein
MVKTLENTAASFLTKWLRLMIQKKQRRGKWSVELHWMVLEVVSSHAARYIMIPVCGDTMAKQLPEFRAGAPMKSSRIKREISGPLAALIRKYGHLPVMTQRPCMTKRPLLQRSNQDQSWHF